LTESCTCGEARDRADLNLTGVQESLIKAIYATGTPVVVVLINGRPLSVNWTAANVPAIIEAWLPGEEGAEAITDVLFGDVNPGGKLAITFPRSVGQIPIYYSHKPSGGRSHWKGTYADLSNKPLWPFGFGLSYTQFRLDNLQVDRSRVRAGEQVKISLDVANVGMRAGDEVVQLYIRDLVASISQPVKALKGFKRVYLDPGQKKRITFTLSVNQLGFYDRTMNFVVEPGEVELMIGTSADDLPLTATINIVGEITDVEQDKVFCSEAKTFA
jgi:beta-glucosidase